MPQISETKETHEEEHIHDSGGEIRSKSFPTCHQSRGLETILKAIFCLNLIILLRAKNIEMVPTKKKTRLNEVGNIREGFKVRKKSNR